MKFNEMTYSRPDIKALSSELEALKRQIENAEVNQNGTEENQHAGRQGAMGIHNRAARG